MEHDSVIREINTNIKNTYPNITGKKRKYEDAMEYANDYETVQEYTYYISNNIEIKGSNWIDSFLENIKTQKK
jgi:hypothetical protein